MDSLNPWPWYKKKRYLVPLGLVALLVLSGGDNAPQNQSAPQRMAPVVQQVEIKSAMSSGATQELPRPVDTAQRTLSPAPDSNSGLSNDSYYTNSAGNEVHSPAYSDTVPSGASAQCRDGTYSFSQSRRGTCSHHGGVANWL